MSPPLLAALIALGLFALAKLATIVRARRDGVTAPPRRWLAFALAWHGMAPEEVVGATARAQPSASTARAPTEAALAAVRLATGLALLILAVALPTAWPDAVRGAVALSGFALALHFGVLRCTEAAWHARGVAVTPLMRAPQRARSLQDFWARRWNTAYAALARRVVFTPLRQRIGSRAAHLATFLVSGLVHELAISVPAGAGFGGPTAYFAIQGAGDLVQRRIALRSRLTSLVVTWSVVLAPLPLLFHPPFLREVALPLTEILVPAAFPRDVALPVLLRVALLTAALAQGGILAAGIQVPRRLEWKRELAALSSFNRRIVWAYHAFVGLTIAAFGVLTAMLVDDMVEGERAALGLAALIAAWWTMRLVVDAFWYRAEDWPPGAAVAAGHATLVTGFLGVASSYAALLIAHAAGGLP